MSYPWFPSFFFYVTIQFPRISFSRLIMVNCSWWCRAIQNLASSWITTTTTTCNLQFAICNLKLETCTRDSLRCGWGRNFFFFLLLFLSWEDRENQNEFVCFKHYRAVYKPKLLNTQRHLHQCKAPAIFSCISRARIFNIKNEALSFVAYSQLCVCVCVYLTTRYDRR